MKHPATDTAYLARLLDSHLGHLKLFVSQTNQCAAADASFIGSREENPGAQVQDSCLWIGKNGLVIWLYTEEAADPFFIEPSECGCIPWLNLADADFGDGRGLFFGERHVHSPALLIRR